MKSGLRIAKRAKAAGGKPKGGATCEVRFFPQDRAVRVPAGTSVLEAAVRARITLDDLCGGHGVCGRCRMVVKEGSRNGNTSALLTPEETARGAVLACQCRAEGDMLVEIPEGTRVRDSAGATAARFLALPQAAGGRKFAPSPLVDKIFLRLDPPTLENPLPDCARVERAVEKAIGRPASLSDLSVIRRLPGLLRSCGFAVTALIRRSDGAAEVLDVEAGDTSARNVIAAVDIGTSTVVVHLIDAADGRTLDAQACFNGQATYGRELTPRIISAEKNGAGRLQELIVEDINRLIAAAAAGSGVKTEEITAVVAAGNTVMNHFLLGLPTGDIRRKPYVPATVEPPPARASELGIAVHPRAPVISVPGISGWVGGDVTGGILATGLFEMDEIGMLIDIGTNGEIVIGNKDWLVATSASAGPALEGASVRCGMMAEAGAIESVRVEGGDLRLKVIGGAAPRGLCGSGIIDLIAALLELGVIDRSGRFVAGSDPRVKFDGDLGRFVFPGADGVGIDQNDVANVISAKAAIFAATKIILDRLHMGVSDVRRLFIAGGFGNYIDIENAVAIGLLPDLPRSNIKYVGNTSLLGAKMAALSDEAYRLMREIRRRTTYYDLMGASDYVEQYTEALFLPHTNIEMFPSYRERRVSKKAAGGR
jgi:uncharacterized 2Fe-2S/4Fe-4S cluster protein (DUF4445 family)